MDIYRTQSSIYTHSLKYPALRVELMLDGKLTEIEAEERLLQALAQAEAEYERSQRVQVQLDPEGKPLLDKNEKPGEVEISRDRPTLSTIRRWIREYRNRLLAESDFVMLPDVVVDKRAWQKYRQALRDLPQVWKLDDVPSVDVSAVYEYADVAKLPFPQKPG